MKKEYMKPESAVLCVVSESIVAVSGSGGMGSEGMGSNETPGGADAFNAPLRRGKWGSLWY